MSPWKSLESVTVLLKACAMRAIRRELYLSAWWLGEPQCPLVHKWVLDREIVRVVKDGDRLIRVEARLSVALGA